MPQSELPSSEPSTASDLVPTAGETQPSESDASMHRRMLMAGAGLLGAAAFARLAQAGPLSPPAGPIGPTGRSTDELYLASTKGCIPLNQTTAPGNAQYQYIINQPGSYYLTADANAPQGGAGAIVINTARVFLNLNGYTINRTTPVTNASGVVWTGFPVGGGSIRNGAVYSRTGGSGLFVNCDSLVIEDICLAVASSGNHVGINLQGSKGVVIRRCTVSAEMNSTFTALTVTGANTAVEDCNFSPFSPIGAGLQLGANSVVRRTILNNTLGNGIELGSGSVVADCHLSLVGGIAISGAAENAIDRCVIYGNAANAITAVQVGPYSRVADCHIDNYPGATQSAIKATGGGTFVTDNQITRCGIAINFTNVSGCYALRNRCHGNTVSIAVNFGGNWYPTINDLNQFTNPLANIFA